MAFLSAGPGVELAGSIADPALSDMLADWSQSVAGDATELVGGFIRGAANRIVESAWLRNSIMILTPTSLPPVELPFQVRQAQGGKGDDKCLPCIEVRYFLILFNTHSANFTVKQCRSKQEMIDSYNAAVLAVLKADDRFREADANLVGQNAHNMAEFKRVPAGIFRHDRLVQVNNQLVSFGGLASYNAGGVALQMFGNKAQSLDGKTGSWERFLDIAKINHKKGPEIGHIGSSIADFIGLWASTTGDIASIGAANGGVISPSAPFVSSFKTFMTCLSCSCYDVGNPENNATIKYRFDTMAAWQ